jgi:uncharacterized membrane protein YphA (DoxX/SURF4 family)
MLNPFPIQFLSMLAYVILRIIVGIVFLILGYRHFKNRKALAETFSFTLFPFGSLPSLLLICGELTIGTMFVLGLYTQYAALGALVLSLYMLLFRKRLSHASLPGRLFYLLIFGISASLFITGAGAFAFDLPI